MKKNKKKFDELLKDFNSREIEADSIGCWEENVPSDLYEKHLGDVKYKEISEIEVESDRWCKIVTTVIEIHGKYLGITHVSEIHDLQTNVYDCLSHIKVKEMNKTKKSAFKEK